MLIHNTTSTSNLHAGKTKRQS